MNNNKGLIYILMATLMFSGMEIAIKATNGAFNPIQLNLIRFTIGAVILYPLARRQLSAKGYRLTAKDYAQFNLLGFVCTTFGMTFFTLSVNYIPAHQSALIFAGNIYFSILFAYVILKEVITRFDLAAMAVSFTGLMILINPFRFEGSAIGVISCLTSAIAFAFYGVLAKLFSRGKPTGGVVTTCYSFIFGSLQLALLIVLSRMEGISGYVVAKGLPIFADIPVIRAVSMDNLPYLLYISIGVTGMGFAFYFLAIDTVGVTMTSLVFFIKPVLVPVLAYLVLGEEIPVRSLVGLGFMLVGSAILFYSNVRKIRAMV